MVKEWVGAIAPKRINRGLMDGRQGWEKLCGGTAVCFSRKWGPVPRGSTPWWLHRLTGSRAYGLQKDLRPPTSTERPESSNQA